MEEKIKNLALDIIKDVEELKKSGADIEKRLPIEIMALNAVANAYEKTK